MKRPRLFIPPLMLATVCAVCTTANAAVVVFANSTDAPVTFALVVPGEKMQAYRIAAGDVLPLPVHGPTTVRLDAGARIVDRQASPNSICVFVGAGQLDVTEQRFAGGDESVSLPAASSDESPADPVGTYPVMILVDEDEPAVRRLWEARLRQRVRDASAIFERHCRMRLEVVAVDTWESNNAITDFSLSLREFERNVRLREGARLAIGFTSQYRKPDERRVHLGGTRGPLHPYLLVREWSQHITEPERLEVLVHELGHVLGASHSAEAMSVMRPLVGDRQSRARGFRIGFDPLNTMAMYVFCEQLRLRGARRLAQFSPGSRVLLSSVYSEMDRQLPGDMAAARYLAIVGSASQEVRAMASDSLTAATQSVVRAVAQAALTNHARPIESPLPGATRLRGDTLADYYVRAAAAEASRLPEPFATKAFLLGLAYAMEPRGAEDHRTRSDADHLYETPQQRRERLAVLGKPSIHGREDLLRHFTVAAALCARLGVSSAETLSTLKELADMQGPSGFSFADLAADFAGIELAAQLEKSHLTLKALARSFEARRFVPPPSTLAEKVTLSTFKEQYGDFRDPRFRREVDSVRRQVRVLPGYADGTD